MVISDIFVANFLNLNMNKIIFSLLAITSLNLYSQKHPSPVKWDFELTSNGTNKSEFKAIATINPGWNIYAVYMSDEGPIPTSFTFETIENGELEDKIVEKSKPIKGFDPLFEMEVIKFKETAEFIQVVKNKTGAKPIVKGYVTYMTCDSERCLPPVDVPFNVK
jgi:thiol:disulfide interchange protein DsbD